MEAVLGNGVSAPQLAAVTYEAQDSVPHSETTCAPPAFLQFCYMLLENACLPERNAGIMLPAAARGPSEQQALVKSACCGHSHTPTTLPHPPLVAARAYQWALCPSSSSGGTQQTQAG